MALDFIPGTDEEIIDWDTLTLSGTTYTWAYKRLDHTTSGIGFMEQGQIAGNGGRMFQSGLGPSVNAGFRVKDDSGLDQNTIVSFGYNTGEWMSLIGVRAGNTVHGYIGHIGDALLTNSGSPGSYGAITSSRFIVGGIMGDDTKGGTTSAEMDGFMAEIAVWDGVHLNAGERQAYHDGVPANMIRPGSLIFYAPLWGSAVAASHENIATATKYNPTFNGTPTIAATHPPQSKYVNSPANYNLSPNVNKIGTISGNVQIAGRALIT